MQSDYHNQRILATPKLPLHFSWYLLQYNCFMKYTYCFIFGKTPQLSLAELMAVLGPAVELVSVTIDAAIVATAKPLDCEQVQDQLGGTIKIGIIFGSEADYSTADWSNWYQPLAARFQFGFSAYGLSRSERLALKKIGLRLKKLWQSRNLACRLVVSQEAALSSVIVLKEKLLNPGADFLVIKNEAQNKFWLGQTVTGQKFADYAEKEFGRPQADAKRGMIPLKLAKMMINLARLDSPSLGEAGPARQVGLPQGSLLDPFCGLGTLVTTAADLGWRQLAGSDLDARVIKQAKINWAWLIQKQFRSLQVDFKVGSATQLSQVWPQQKFQAIVTEPDLGPALKSLPSPEQLKLIQQKLISLYQDFLTAARGVLTPTGRLVMVWPIWQTGKLWQALPKEKIIKSDWWQVINFQPDNFGLQPELFNQRGSLWYARPDQTVGREIWVLAKK